MARLTMQALDARITALEGTVADLSAPEVPEAAVVITQAPSAVPAPVVSRPVDLPPPALAMPEVPASFGVGAIVQLKGTSETSVVHQVGNGLIVVDLLDNGVFKRVPAPWTQFTLVTAAP